MLFRSVKTEFYKLERYHILWAGVALMLSLIHICEEYFYDDSNIMAIISRLRKKLEVNPSSPKYIPVSYTHLTTEETAGADVTSFRFNLSDGTSYDLIYACYGCLLYTSGKISNKGSPGGGPLHPPHLFCTAQKLLFGPLYTCLLYTSLVLLVLAMQAVVRCSRFSSSSLRTAGASSALSKSRRRDTRCV